MDKFLKINIYNFISDYFLISKIIYINKLHKCHLKSKLYIINIHYI